MEGKSRIDRLMLVRRTAWRNMQIEEHPELRKPKPTDREAVSTALYMLAYIGAIDMAIYDLVDELTEAGLYRHGTKATVKRIAEIVAKANGEASDILCHVNGGERVRQYSDMYEYAYSRTQEHVLLAPPERAYNIVRAYARLFSKAYETVGRNLSHTYLDKASKALKRLDIPQLKDHNIDTIIERAVQIVQVKA